MLVFFKSYTHLTHIQKFIKENGLKFQKRVYWEQQRNKSEFEKDVKKYEEDAQNEAGAIFMAVCRGKLSEGYNFKDNLARAVFIVGFPLMNLDCLQYRIQQYIQPDSKKLDEWYYKDASVAINQAAGRLIRHTNDFGCLYILGEMACSRRRLPIWIQKCPIEDGIPFDKVVENTKKYIEWKKGKGLFNCPPAQVERFLDESFSGSE